LGFTSESEKLDAWFEEVIPLEHLSQSILKTLPPGMEINEIEVIDLHAPPLQTQVDSAIYQITFLDDIPELDERVKRIMTAEHLPRIRRNKSYDLRPLIEDMTLMTDESGNQRLQIQLSARESATGRPEEVLDEMGIKFEDTRVHRQKIIYRV
jgi:radical SAM-linked protein